MAKNLAPKILCLKYLFKKQGKIYSYTFCTQFFFTRIRQVLSFFVMDWMDVTSMCKKNCIKTCKSSIAQKKKKKKLCLSFEILMLKRLKNIGTRQYLNEPHMTNTLYFEFKVQNLNKLSSKMNYS